jgi:hypothetical protein
MHTPTHPPTHTHTHTTPGQVKALLERNRAALDALVEALLEEEQLPGSRVREVAESKGHPDDLAERRKGMELALI